MKRPLIFLIISCILSTGLMAQIRSPYEMKAPRSSKNPIDVQVKKELKKMGISMANHCSDGVFIRRVHLDLIGALPDPDRVEAFLDDNNPKKRSELIDELLERDEYADYFALKWCDLLRVKAEFPINLWPNAVQAYHHWILQSIRDNTPYDKFARELLTSSGSNFRTPQVNFFRAIQGKSPQTIASAAALTFMGIRLEKWSQEKQDNLKVFFSRVSYKGTAEWKEEIVCPNPEPYDGMDAILPDGKNVNIPRDGDPRQAFADWLITKNNPWFARTIVNRYWAWFMGRGIVHEPDDMGPDNPPIYPGLLKCLEKELIKKRYDLKELIRLILNSRVYQQSPIPNTNKPDADQLFACFPVRQLDAEVLIDALCWISGTTETYTSPIPEPFTNIPEEHRTITLSDGSITSQFLEMFGRPARDTGLIYERNNKTTAAQRLHMLNSTHIQNKIERSKRLGKILRSARRKGNKVINLAYLNILSRRPTEDEMNAAIEYSRNKSGNPKEAAIDLVWALINSKEFLYQH